MFACLFLALAATLHPAQASELRERWTSPTQSRGTSQVLPLEPAAGQPSFRYVHPLVFADVRLSEGETSGLRLALEKLESDWIPRVAEVLGFPKSEIEQRKIELLFDRLPVDSAFGGITHRLTDLRPAPSALGVITFDISSACGAGFEINAIHELQHVFFQLQRGSVALDAEDELNEGLSLLLVYRLTGKLPKPALERLWLGGELHALDSSESRAHGRLEDHEMQELLYALYVASHEGGDPELGKMVLPSPGDPSILSLDRFANFALAAGINRNGVGSANAFRLLLTDDPYLNGRRMRAPLLLFSGNVSELALARWSARYLTLVPGDYCLEFELGEGTWGYVFDPESKGPHLREVGQELGGPLCLAARASYSLDSMPLLILIRGDAGPGEAVPTRIRIRMQ